MLFASALSRGICGAGPGEFNPTANVTGVESEKPAITNSLNDDAIDEASLHWLAKPYSDLEGTITPPLSEPAIEAVAILIHRDEVKRAGPTARK